MRIQCLAVLIAVSACAFSAPGLGQERPDVADTADPATTGVVTPAETGDVDEVVRQLRRLAETAGDSEPLETIGVLLEEEARKFEEQFRTYLDAEDLAAFGEFELRETRAQALLSLTNVRDWRQQASTKLTQLSAARDELRKLTDDWSQRLAAEEAAAAPDALLVRIRALIASMEDVRATLRQRSESFLELDDRLISLNDQLEAVIADVDNALIETKRRFFALDQPPLWKFLLGEPAGSADAATDATTLDLLRTSGGRLWAGLQQFWATYTERTVVQIVLFVLLLAGMLALSRSSALKALEEISGSLRVLNCPISSAILITLLLTPFLYPTLPQAVVINLQVLSLVPIWRLISTLAPVAWRRPLHLGVIIFAFAILLALLPEGHLASRFIILGMSAAAIWLATVGARGLLQADSFQQWRGAWFVRLVRWLAIVMLTGAIAANLVGAVRLSQFLVLWVVDPAYTALALILAVFVVEDFFRLLMHARSVRNVRSVVFHRELLIRRLSLLTRWAAVGAYLWLEVIFLDIGPTIFGFFTDLFTASAQVGAYKISLGSVLVFILAVWITFLTARFATFILDNDVLPRMRLGRGVAGTISKTTEYLIVGIGLLLAISIAGVDITKITLIVGALSVGIGFGLQNVVNNFISGIILLFERPIQVGDTVQVGELFGVVKRIGIRASNVRTYSGAEVIVPNGNLVSDQVINWTLSDRFRRLELDVGVAYGNRPVEVLGVLEDALVKNEVVQKDPAPFARFRGFGDSALNFTLYAWVDFEEGIALTSDILSSVYDALEEAGIQIPFPQRDLHVRSVSENAGRVLRGAEA